MFTTIWQLLTSSFGKSIYPIIKFILTTGKDLLKIYGTFNHAYSLAEYYYNPPPALVNEMISQGFEVTDNCKRMYARKIIVEGLKHENIVLKDMWLDVLNVVYFYIKKQNIKLA